ncbi:MAG: hypothetical protein F4Y21_12010, partial [Gemmatimonadetes bacterium]|nr:hypothetical protein [Gemmatimonadota bacterium]
ARFVLNPTVQPPGVSGPGMPKKGMLIGKGGAGIRAVGTRARPRIEHFLGRPVYLDLWVKVWPGWRRKKEGLMAFGYRVPNDGA